MSLITRYALPTMLIRGQAATLTLDVYSAASAQQTPTVGTFALYDGAEELVAPVAVTSLGPPASYSLSASVIPTTRPLSEDLLEVWSLTIGGTVYPFQRPAMLVRRAFHPVITDTDLLQHDSDLLNITPSTVTNLSQYREEARKHIEGYLIQKGRRPWLILDPWVLRLPHILLSLHYFYADAAVQIGDGRYKERAADLLSRAVTMLDQISYRYDAAESGVVDSPVRRSSSPVVILSSGRQRYYRGTR